MRNFIHLAIGTSFLLSGCANVGVTQLKPATSKSPTCSLDIYSSEKDITQPYEVVCLIDSRTGTTAFHKKTGAAAIEQAKSKACECGADAMLVETIDTAGITLMTWGKGTAIIKAIRYLPDK